MSHNEGVAVGTRRCVARHRGAAAPHGPRAQPLAAQPAAGQEFTEPLTYNELMPVSLAQLNGAADALYCAARRARFTARCRCLFGFRVCLSNIYFWCTPALEALNRQKGILSLCLFSF